MDVQKMQKELEHLLAEVHWIQQKLKNLPEENISCERDKQYIRWYLISEGKRNYLPRSQEKLANKLMQKKYYLARLKDDLDEITFLKKCLKIAPPHTRRIDKLLSPDSSYHNLLLSAVFNDEVSWSTTDYQRSNNYPEKLIHNTYAGILVRSKSEVLIANALFSKQIPFRYEACLQLGSHTVYPDFTIRHPVTKKIYYWEHLGMMGEEDYLDNALTKIRRYCRNNIYPNLLASLYLPVGDFLPLCHFLPNLLASRSFRLGSFSRSATFYPIRPNIHRDKMRSAHLALISGRQMHRINRGIPSILLFST